MPLSNERNADMIVFMISPLMFSYDVVIVKLAMS